MYEQMSQEEVVAFLQRIDATCLTGRTTLEAWKYYLAKTTSSSGTLKELEQRWLNIKGGSGKTNSDLAHSYLNSKGTSGTIADKLKKFAKEVSTP